MPAIVSSKFRVHNAEQFREAFSETANTIMYFFLGRNTTWADENNPPTPVNSTANVEFTPWREMIAAKRVLASDVTHAIPRYNWTSGTVYDQYDDQDTNLLSDDFYVMTDDFNVYKCLFNAGGTASTTKPTGVSTSKFTTADGYIWKYMYTISTGNALKFLTTEYIPVQTLESDDGSEQWDVQTAAIDGTIETIFVTNGGSGYFSGNTTVSIVGDGTGATANVTTSGNPGTITAITVTTPGSGYTTATVTISGDGTNATGRAIISPKGGHGANAIEELGGKYIMLNVRLDGSEANTITTANEFRQVGLVRDPTTFGSSTRSFVANQRQTYRYTLTAVTSGPFLADEVVLDAGSNTAIVVEYDSANEYLYTLKPLDLDFANGAVLTGNTSGASGTISAISTPGLQPYSGDLLYVENRVPIARAADQIEDVKLIIEF